MRLMAWLFSCLTVFPCTWQEHSGMLEPINSSNIGRIQQIAEFEDVQGLRFAGWTPDSKYIVVTTAYEIRLYPADDMISEPILLYESNEEIAQIAFSDDFERMAISSGTHEIPGRR